MKSGKKFVRQKLRNLNEIITNLIINSPKLVNLEMIFMKFYQNNTILRKYLIIVNNIG